MAKKEEIKNGNNVSIGDITVINSDISLEEKEEVKADEAATVPETTAEVSDEIKPDVVVNGDGATIAAPQVDPIPVPEPTAIQEQAPIELPNIPTPEVPPIIPPTATVPTFDSFQNGMNNDVNNINNQGVFDNNISSFGQNNLTGITNTNDAPQYSMLNNNFQYDNNDVSSYSPQNFDDSLKSTELPSGLESAIVALRANISDYITKYNEMKNTNAKDEQKIFSLENEVAELKDTIVKLQNMVANYKSQIAAYQDNVLRMFGMGVTNSGQQPNITGPNMDLTSNISNFNDNQKNNGYNMAA